MQSVVDDVEDVVVVREGQSHLNLKGRGQALHARHARVDAGRTLTVTTSSINAYAAGKLLRSVFGWRWSRPPGC